ncbi:unnamed protein product [Paramecium primaurelia]|nr:unnamed protein product [Paramecium primaurelia]
MTQKWIQKQPKDRQQLILTKFLRLQLNLLENLIINMRICQIQCIVQHQKLRKQLKNKYLNLKQKITIFKLYEQCSDPVTAYLVDFALKKNQWNKQIIFLNTCFFIQLTYFQLMLQYYKMKNISLISQRPAQIVVQLGQKQQVVKEKKNCGNFPEEDEYFQNYKQTQKYVFEISEKGVKFQERTNTNQQNASQTSQKTTKISKDGKQGIVRKGCGAPLTWSEIPPLNEFQIKELIDPGIVDYLAYEIPKEELKKRTKVAQQSLKQRVEQAKDQLKVVRL